MSVNGKVLNEQIEADGGLVWSILVRSESHLLLVTSLSMSGGHKLAETTHRIHINFKLKFLNFQLIGEKMYVEFSTLFFLL